MYKLIVLMNNVRAYKMIFAVQDRWLIQLLITSGSPVSIELPHFGEDVLLRF